MFTVTCDDYDDTPHWALVPQFDGNLSLQNVKKLSQEYDTTKSTDFTVEFILFTNENSKSGLNISVTDLGGLQKLFNPENPKRSYNYKPLIAK